MHYIVFVEDLSAKINVCFLVFGVFFSVRNNEICHDRSYMEGWSTTVVEGKQDNRQRTTLQENRTEIISTDVRHGKPSIELNAILEPFRKPYN